MQANFLNQIIASNAAPQMGVNVASNNRLQGSTESLFASLLNGMQQNAGPQSIESLLGKLLTAMDGEVPNATVGELINSKSQAGKLLGQLTQMLNANPNNLNFVKANPDLAKALNIKIAVQLGTSQDPQIKLDPNTKVKDLKHNLIATKSTSNLSHPTAEQLLNVSNSQNNVLYAANRFQPSEDELDNGGLDTDDFDNLQVHGKTNSSLAKLMPQMQAKVIDLSNVPAEDANELIAKITDYLNANALNNKNSIDLVFKHDAIGMFRINVANLHANGNEALSMQILSASREGYDFFKANQGALQTALANAGVILDDFKVLATNSNVQNAFANLDDQDNGKDQFNQNFGNGQNHNDNQSNEQRDSNRRRNLWHEYAQYKERYSA